MKYISLDLETTSLEPSQNNILMVSMVLEDSEHPEVPVEQLPHFTCFVMPNEPIQGQIYALAMNDWILGYLSGRTKNPPYPILNCNPNSVITHEINGTKQQISGYWANHAKHFINLHFGNKRATVAGKNVAGFDMQFLPNEIKKCFRHKVLDPATMYVDWSKDDQAPGLEECKKRAGIDTPVAHDARLDAIDVILLFRKAYAV